MKSVGFCVDGGARLGLGHFRRCRTLSLALPQDQCCAFFMAVNVDDEGWAWLKEQGLDASRLPAWEADHVFDTCNSKHCETVVVDTYAAEKEFLGLLLQSGVRTLVIDDLGHRELLATWVTNSAASPDDDLYDGLTAAELLLGPSYAVVRKEFTALPTRTYADRVRRIVVTMGGADPRNDTQRVLEVLGELNDPLDVKVVVGPLAANEKECRALATESVHEVEVIGRADHMAALMLWADLAISAAGQTLFELAATGCPCIAIKVADNQALNCQLFASMGAARILDESEQNNEALRGALTQLLNDSVERERMGRAGAHAVDGRGASRLADVLIGERRM